MRQHVDAIEYLDIPVTVDDGEADPTTAAVSIAIVDHWAEVTDDDFVDAAWVAGAANPYLARILVGPAPGVIELTLGWNRIVWRASDTPEAPIRPAGAVFGHR